VIVIVLMIGLHVVASLNFDVFNEEDDDVSLDLCLYPKSSRGIHSFSPPSSFLSTGSRPLTAS
jgi:hypothetical protein